MNDSRNNHNCEQYRQNTGLNVRIQSVQPGKSLKKGVDIELALRYNAQAVSERGDQKSPGTLT